MTKENSKNQVSHNNDSEQHQIVQQTILSEYRGPVPPPQVLEQLNKTLPSAAERIFVMAEKEQEAAIQASRNADSLDKEKESNRHAEVRTSLWMAFLFSMSSLSAGSFLVFYGHDVIGSVLLGTTIAGVVGAFLNKKQDK